MENKETKGLLPFNTTQLQELLAIYQRNYEDLQEAYHQLLATVVMMLEDNGPFEFEVARMEEMRTSGQKYEIKIEPLEEGARVKVSVQPHTDNVPDGPVSDSSADERPASDTG